MYIEIHNLFTNNYFIITNYMHIQGDEQRCVCSVWQMLLKTVFLRRMPCIVIAYMFTSIIIQTVRKQCNCHAKHVHICSIKFPIHTDTPRKKKSIIDEKCVSLRLNISVIKLYIEIRPRNIYSKTLKGMTATWST